MRLLTLLYAFYVLLLPMVPCADGAEHKSVQLIEVPCKDQCSQGLCTTDGLGDKQEEDDGCSPFCACACCYPHVARPVERPIISLASEETIFHHHHASHIAARLSAWHYNIWQPPKNGCIPGQA